MQFLFSIGFVFIMNVRVFYCCDDHGNVELHAGASKKASDVSEDFKYCDLEKTSQKSVRSKLS